MSQFDRQLDIILESSFFLEPLIDRYLETAHYNGPDAMKELLRAVIYQMHGMEDRLSEIEKETQAVMRGGYEWGWRDSNTNLWQGGSADWRYFNSINGPMWAFLSWMSNLRAKYEYDNSTTQQPGRAYPKGYNPFTERWKMEEVIEWLGDVQKFGRAAKRSLGALPEALENFTVGLGPNEHLTKLVEEFVQLGGFLLKELQYLRRALGYHITKTMKRWPKR
jgi:hypothetical protein